MPETRIKVKGPIGAVIAVLVIGVVVYMKFFVPFRATSQDKKAIIEKIKYMKMSNMSEISQDLLDEFEKTGKFNSNKTQDIKELTGEVKISDIKGKKTFLSGTKIKVTYTIDGKAPKSDNGTLYFKLYHRKEGRNRTRRRVELSQISEDDFNK